MTAINACTVNVHGRGQMFVYTYLRVQSLYSLLQTNVCIRDPTLARTFAFAHTRGHPSLSRGTHQVPDRPNEENKYDVFLSTKILLEILEKMRFLVRKR